jgi:HEAT repeat protein
MRGGEIDAAEQAVRSFARDHPESRWCPAALLELGERLGEAGRPEGAARALQEVTERYPGTEPARRAHLLLGVQELGRDRFALARRHLERAAPLPEADRLIAELERLSQSELPPEVAGRVEAALRDLSSEDEELGARAVRTLAEVGPRALPRLDHALGLDERLLPLTHTTLAFRIRLVEVCSEWSLDGAIAPLTRLLTDPDPSVSRAALEAMLTLGLSSEDVAEIIDDHPFDTGAAPVVFREKFGAEVPGKVRDLLASEDHEMRVEAARILADLDEPGALDALARLAGDRSPQVRREAAAALGHREEEPAADILAGALSDPSPLVRLQAVGSLVRLGRLEAVRSGGLADPDGRVRLGAARALLDAGEEGDAARVVSLLGDPDAGVRVVVEGLLGVTEGPEIAEALAAALRAADESGHATRIVRVMARQSKTDFGYDPGGDATERARVADAYIDLWRRKAAAD